MLDVLTRRLIRLLDRLPSQSGRMARWTGPIVPDDVTNIHYVPTLVVCLDGVIRVEGRLEKLDLHPGDVLLIAPGVWHLHAPIHGDGVMFGQGFMGRWSDIFIITRASEWYSRVPPQPSSNNLETALHASNADFPELLRAHVLHLLSESELPTKQTNWPAIRMHYALYQGKHPKDLTTADLVRASGCSQSQAYVLFQNAYGITPYQAILHVRLGLAASLLAAGIPVGEVATRTGFASRRAFNRAWLRRGQGPPRSYGRPGPSTRGGMRAATRCGPSSERLKQ